MKKLTCLILSLLVLTVCFCSCKATDNKNDEILPPSENTMKEDSITKEDAYNLYYDTIKKFVPELMTEPQECDVEIKTRDEVTFLSENFVRETSVRIISQNVGGKLQYCLLNKFTEANKINFYCINDDKFYSLSANLKEKGNLNEWNSSYISSFTFPYLNTPLFELDAIKSFAAKKKGSNVEISFVINGSTMEENYPGRVMKEINPTLDDNLDDVKIVLTVDENGVPQSMSTEISMSKFNNDKLHAKKTLNMDFVFDSLENVDFDLKNIVTQYALNASSFENFKNEYTEIQTEDSNYIIKTNKEEFTEYLYEIYDNNGNLLDSGFHDWRGSFHISKKDNIITLEYGYGGTNVHPSFRFYDVEKGIASVFFAGPIATNNNLIAHFSETDTDATLIVHDIFDPTKNLKEFNGKFDKYINLKIKEFYFSKDGKQIILEHYETNNEKNIITETFKLS